LARTINGLIGQGIAPCVRLLLPPLTSRHSFPANYGTHQATTSETNAETPRFATTCFEKTPMNSLFSHEIVIPTDPQIGKQVSFLDF
jgi:hypothetical protein